MRTDNRFYSKYIKRILDIVCSLIFLVVFCWLYAILALLVRNKLGKPVLFRQERPGQIDPKTGKERIFQLYKFRTMTDDRDEKGELLPDAVRLTRFGRVLRATSLDELPEMLNILAGQMSFIGPRPLAVSYLKYYTSTERHRHDLRPGLTGLAQVNGRNSISWNKKFKYDLDYVRNCSFVMDLKILLLTVKKVLIREGINQGEEMPENLYDVRADWLDENGCIKSEYDRGDTFTL